MAASPMAPELVRRTREVLPPRKLVQGYGLTETGFLTACTTMTHACTAHVLRPKLSRIDLQVLDESGREGVEAGTRRLVARGTMSGAAL